MKFWFGKRDGVWGVTEGNVTRIVRDFPMHDLDPTKFLVPCPVCTGDLYCGRCNGTGFDGGF